MTRVVPLEEFWRKTTKLDIFESGNIHETCYYLTMVCLQHGVHIVVFFVLLTYLEARSFNQTWLQTLGFSSKRFHDLSRSNKLPPGREIPQDEEDVRQERMRADATNEEDGKSVNIHMRHVNVVCHVSDGYCVLRLCSIHY